MNRFFLPTDCINAGEVRFPEAISHQISQVLRLKIGEEVMALDNSGFEYRVEIAQASAYAVTGKIKGRQACQGEPSGRVSLYLGLTQREKFETMLQKCTEAGAAAFTPVITSRSLVQTEKDISGKQERWNRIICEAAEQSGRGLLPSLSPALKFKRALKTTSQHGLVLFLWEKETSVSLRQALQSYLQRSASGSNAERNVALLIGPEGGYSDQEAEQARRAGCIPVSLGKRILRMETAALVATALVLYEMGDMG
ncbi:MAG TPA: RsmE family RNA methyltransferase [Anaerolineaceae bacterium]|nr:RsmE family RNA methyltransferase [Anaerolineaceae bacterium]